MSQALQDRPLGKLLTARQVAEFLQVHITTVRRWSRNGVLKSHQIGYRGDRRYSEADVLGFLVLRDKDGYGEEQRWPSIHEAAW